MDYYDKLRSFSRLSPVERLQSYRHHLVTNVWDHSCRVARISYRLARGLRLSVDEDALLRGAMLHDYYLYQRSAEHIRPYPHFVRHPKIALRNAQALFPLSEKEKNIILSHMWPVDLRARPRSREAWLVCMADKLATVYESTAGAWRALRK